MALPTSTIVMAVLTCIPFGLAIRDTINGTVSGPRTDEGFYDDENSEAEVARAVAQSEEEDAERARVDELEAERWRTGRRTLFGAEVATLGSGFDGISLGMPEVDLQAEAVSELELATHVDIEFLTNDKIEGLVIKAERDGSEDGDAELCATLGADLKQAWGGGKTEDYASWYWINPTAGTRASLHPESCQLSVERYAEPVAWVSRTKKSIVPIWLVGQSVAKLREHIGARSEFEDTDASVRWLDLGVGTGRGEARLVAYVANRKVIAITATTDTLETTHQAVAEQLTALYGEPIDDDEGVHWNSRPPIHLTDRDGAGVALTIGKLPDGE